MTDPLSSCPDCGSPLPPDSPQALCPACLMRQALASRTVVDGDHPAPASPPLTPEELGEKFPGYEILQCLGRGGMGVVYKARQKSLNRLVAIKILAPERGSETRFAERFAQEAELLAKLNHPHIVTIHDFGETGGLFYLVMEFIDGVNLRDLLRDGKLESQQALAIVPPICDALQFAHEKGIVHRDIKPENLLLDREGRIKIADFGIAKLIGPVASVCGRRASEEDSQRRSQTAATIQAGTQGYSAPEQANGTADHRADIYALGVVLYEMLTGERPDRELVAPSKKVHIDVRLDEIVLRALERTPELRYQTAGEFRTVLETVVETFLTTPPSSSASFLHGNERVEECDPSRPQVASTDADGARQASILPFYHRPRRLRDCWPWDASFLSVVTAILASFPAIIAVCLMPVLGAKSLLFLILELIPLLYVVVYFSILRRVDRLRAKVTPDAREIAEGLFATRVLQTPCLAILADDRLELLGVAGQPITIPLSDIEAATVIRWFNGRRLWWKRCLKIERRSAPAVAIALAECVFLRWKPYLTGQVRQLELIPTKDRVASSPVNQSCFSLTAIIGASWLAFIPVHFLFPLIMPPDWKHNALIELFAMLQALLFWAAPLGVTILGWISVSQIRRSAGKLHGMWLAVFDGMLLPLLALDVLILGLPFAALRLTPLPDVIFGIKLSLLLIPVGLVLLAFVVASNVFIIRRVWRAVSAENAKSSATEPIQAQTGRSSDAKWIALVCSFAGLAGVAAVVTGVVVPLIGRERSEKAHEQFRAKHRKEFEETTARSKQIEAQLQSGLHATFGPVVELKLEFNGGDKTANLLNLDTGLIERRTFQSEGSEIAEKGPDAAPLLFIGENDQALWFRVRSIVFFKKVATTWWTSDPLVTVKEIERLFPGNKVGYSSPWINDIATDKNEAPQTFLFRTPKGTFGIFQLTGFTADPRGVNIRYKPVRYVPTSEVALEKPGTIKPIPPEAARLLEEMKHLRDIPEFKNLSSDQPGLVKQYDEEINRRLKALQESLHGTNAEALFNEGMLLSQQMREQGPEVNPELRARADALRKQLEDMLKSAAPSQLPENAAQTAKEKHKRTVDLVYVVPNGYRGPVFVAQAREVLPDVAARQKNTLVVTTVDEKGEGVTVGGMEKVSGWEYRESVKQRDGVKIKTAEDRPADDEVAWHQIGGFGPWKRAYRPDGFAAYFIGTRAEADKFRIELERLVNLRTDENAETVRAKADAGSFQPDSAKYGEVELFCQNLNPDGTEKNSTSFGTSPDQAQATFSGMRLDWKLTEHRQDADVYEFRRGDATNPVITPVVESVKFSGKPVVVFESATQRITLAPISSDNSQLALIKGLVIKATMKQMNGTFDTYGGVRVGDSFELDLAKLPTGKIELTRPNFDPTKSSRPYIPFSAPLVIGNIAKPCGNASDGFVGGRFRVSSVSESKRLVFDVGAEQFRKGSKVTINVVEEVYGAVRCMATAEGTLE
jgi:serine/threonine protein kinase